MSITQKKKQTRGTTDKEVIKTNYNKYIDSYKNLGQRDSPSHAKDYGKALGFIIKHFVLSL